MQHVDFEATVCSLLWELECGGYITGRKTSLSVRSKYTNPGTKQRGGTGRRKKMPWSIKMSFKMCSPPNLERRRLRFPEDWALTSRATDKMQISIKTIFLFFV